MDRSSRFSFARILKLVLDVIFVIGIFWMALVLLAFLITMIDPGQKANMFSTSTFYSLEHHDLEKHIQADTTDPKAKIKVKLFGMVLMKTENRWFLLPDMIGYFLWVGLYFVIIVQLRHFFETLESGNPFCSGNARRIKIIGWAIIVSFLLKTIDQFGAVLYMKQVITINGKHLFPPGFLVWDYLRLELLFVGLAVLAISGIFGLGARLKEEQDLTV